MKHYGDIKNLSGYKLPIVDCVCGGSPCQDLSVAGNRAGLAGERSGLYFEQIRIIKELRENGRNNGKSNESVSPRWMVFENVPGLLSSNDGEDFRLVLEKAAQIVQEDTTIPRPPKEGWHYAGCIMGDGFSIAWRIHDAQWFGVAQRRKRLCMLCDFNGYKAGEILFEHWRETERADCDETFISSGEESRQKIYAVGESLPWDSEQKQTTWETSSRDSGESTEETSAYTLKIRGGADRDCYGKRAGKGALIQTELSGTLGVSQDQTLIVIEGNGYRDSHKGDGYKESDVMYTLNAVEQHAVCYDDYEAYGVGNGQAHQWQIQNNVGALNCMHDQQAVLTNHPEIGSVVRRLTPTECARLQGYPDDWLEIGDWTDTKGKVHKDAVSPKFKALGNSIAIPFWMELLRKISEQYDRPATLGSLFDGIGGFPYCWEKWNGKGTALWASEIEEFPIAVTKKHFPEEV